jgi:hypothetical protein
MRWFAFFGFVLASSIFWPSARSAEITVSPAAADGMVAIAVIGTLQLSDGDRFAHAASALRGALVIFNSDGGNLLAGLRIGQLIRLRSFVTLVPDGARCASACAIAWLGGTRRFMQPTARVGFHAAYSIENGVPIETGAGNALVGAYLSRLGLSDEAIVYIEQAHPNEINWLTKEDAAEVGIDVAVLPHMQPDLPKPQMVPDVRPDPLPPPHRSAQAPIDQTAALFASDYFSHWSETNANALQYFESVYAPHVEFFGKPIDRNILIDQKRKFAERWPERVYTVRPSTITARCNDARAMCVMEGIVDWDARNPASGARTAGAANFTMKVTVQHGSVMIESESGSVISRETTGQ